MLLESKIADLASEFASQFREEDEVSTQFTDLNLMTDLTQDGQMEIRIGHQLNAN